MKIDLAQSTYRSEIDGDDRDMAEIFFAQMDGGELLPIVDVTNPAFAVNATGEELAQMFEQYEREREQRQKLPAEILEALSRSTFGQALMKAQGSYLPGLITYQMKLGPDNLRPEMQAIDRRIAGSLPAFSARVRLQDISRLMADGLAGSLDARPGAPLRLINIAGGAAADSWNALILLRREHPNLLAKRKISLAVLDIDESGPRFGERALAALCMERAPLMGLEIGFRIIRYDWSKTDTLRKALADLHTTDSICAITSEGGLFEYGSDEDIVENLKVVSEGTATGAIVVGSVTRMKTAANNEQSGSGVATRPRSMEGFQTLAGRAGWALEHLIERPLSFHVRLLKS